MNEQLESDTTAREALGRITEQVQRRLAGRMTDFHIVVSGQGLVLRGHAPSFYVKQLAQHAVMKSTHLRIQANEIVVSEPGKVEQPP